MNYPSAIQFLYDLQLFGAKFGLDNTLKLAALVGNPQDKLRFIHVAGTNGKGSTCAMLESIYRAAGLRVGLYTSPHLVSFRERIQVDRQLISEDEVVRLVERLKGVLPNGSTFFEVVTVMALLHFAEQKCDLVIWETGMGGRLDATNIVTPLASVITNIALDHQRWLGETIEQIAFEKAGIIKPRVPIITAARGPALQVIQTAAHRQLAPWTFVSRPTDQHVGLPGEFQRMNAALALAVVQQLQPQIAISDSAIATGLRDVRWPGRFQIIERGNGRKIVLDGAHNPEGVRVLCEELLRTFPSKPAVIFGALADKDWLAMARLIAPAAQKLLLVPVESQRSWNPAEVEISQLVDACHKPSLAAALSAVDNEPLVVITGSLYLVGQALELLDPNSCASERQLNEWSAPALSR